MSKFATKQWLSADPSNGASIQASVSENKSYSLRIGDCIRTTRITGGEKDVGKLEILRDTLTAMITNIKY